MGEVSTIGLDIAKSVFQIHGVDVGGAVVIRKRISRAKLLEFFATLPACLVGIEACPTAHHWSRRLQALGHTVRLLPTSYVKAYLKRSKNDANDAAAICEAVTRPSMRFVATKSEQQQSGLMLHRSRQLLVCQRTMLSNAIRGHMAELGIISAKGRNGTAELVKIIANEQDDRIPAAARFALCRRPASKTSGLYKLLHSVGTLESPRWEHARINRFLPRHILWGAHRHYRFHRVESAVARSARVKRPPKIA
jgi:transposase